ncbi:MAG: lipopolysaccharide transport periplasmic protein LptA [Burkholderiaceae bacterium]
MSPNSPLPPLVAPSARASRRWLLAGCLAAIVAAAGGTGIASAQQQSPPADNAPITVEADQLEYDDRKQVNVFTGNVVLTRGTFEIRADKLLLRKDAQGNQLATATGTPASFRQQRDATGETIEGTGRELQYDDQKQELQILDNAQLRKLNSGRVADEVEGGRIVYRRDTDFFTVFGSPDGANGSKGRVRLVIQPRETEKAAKPAPVELKPSRPSKGAGS